MKQLNQYHSLQTEADNLLHDLWDLKNKGNTVLHVLPSTIRDGYVLFYRVIYK